VRREKEESAKRKRRYCEEVEKTVGGEGKTKDSGKGRQQEEEEKEIERGREDNRR